MHTLRLKTIIISIFNRLGYRFFKPNPYSVFDFESFLERHLIVHKSLTFVQIGANDGIMNDPLYRFNQNHTAAVSGFVLEPLPDIFMNLVENYRNCPKIIPVNVAIHEENSEMEIYRIKQEHEKALPKFARGIASFDPNHWEKTKLVPSADYVQSEKVKCISLKNFTREREIHSLDLLLIDTEGHDYAILKAIDFKVLKPKIIRFEHGVRDGLMSKNQFNEVCSILNSNGYQIVTESYDATAYQLNSDDLVF